jgi:hypothetical protein
MTFCRVAGYLVALGLLAGATETAFALSTGGTVSCLPGQTQTCTAGPPPVCTCSGASRKDKSGGGTNINKNRNSNPGGGGGKKH